MGANLLSLMSLEERETWTWVFTKGRIYEDTGGKLSSTSQGEMPETDPYILIFGRKQYW